MAPRKRKNKKEKIVQRARQESSKPSARLKQAIEALKKGKLEDANLLAGNVVKRAGDGKITDKAREVLAEAAFRQAAKTSDLAMRLSFLDQALQQTPDDARLHNHRIVTLISLGKLADGQEEFEWFEKYGGQQNGSQQPKIELIRQLALLRQDRAVDESQLTAEEARVLQLVQSFANGASKKQVSSLVTPSPLLPESYANLWLALHELGSKPKSASDKVISTLNDAAALTPVANYYQGVAALRQQDHQSASDAWSAAAKRGFQQPWFEENRNGLLREQLSEVVQEERWQEIVEAATENVHADGDKFLNEIVATAYFQLGYSSIKAGNWSQALAHWQQANELQSSRQLMQNLAFAHEQLENWSEAAQAWRETVRRRPRKENHPDFLTDKQVSTIWTRAAECYSKAEREEEWDYYPLYEEKLTCLKNAVKYAPDELALRMKLATAYLEEDRDDAAKNELNRILEIDADHVPALLRLGMIYKEQWGAEPLPLWERALAIEPNNVDARNAVVAEIIDELDDNNPSNWIRRGKPISHKERIKKLKAATKQIPNHPKLLFELGFLYRITKKNKEAIQAFVESWDAASKDVESIGLTMHELLHVTGGDKVVEERLPNVRAISGLRPMFWIDQAASVIHCKLDEKWVTNFWDEAIVISEEKKTPDTLAYTLVSIVESAHDEDVMHLAEKYQSRIRTDMTKSGAIEYLDVYTAMQDDDPKKIIRHLRQAVKKANSAGETLLAEKMKAIIRMINSPLSSILGRMGGMGPMDDDEFGFDPEDILDELFKNLGRGR